MIQRLLLSIPLLLITLYISGYYLAVSRNTSYVGSSPNYVPNTGQPIITCESKPYETSPVYFKRSHLRSRYDLTWLDTLWAPMFAVDHAIRPGYWMVIHREAASGPVGTLDSRTRTPVD